MSSEVIAQLKLDRAVLRERCSFLEREVQQQAKEIERLRQMYESLVETYIRAAAHKMPPITIPSTQVKYGGCPQCGVQLDGCMGYVCGNPSCPTGLGGAQCSTNITK